MLKWMEVDIFHRFMCIEIRVHLRNKINTLIN